MPRLRKCKLCKKPEKLIFGGLYSTLSPYGQVCADCINERPKTVEAYYAKPLKKSRHRTT